MKIEIKNIKSNERLSEETNCFSADLYIDGKKVAQCSNHGHGGNTDVRAIGYDGTDAGRATMERNNALMAEAGKQVIAEYAALPKVEDEIADIRRKLAVEGWGDASNNRPLGAVEALEMHVDDAVDAHINTKGAARDAARIAKTEAKHLAAMGARGIKKALRIKSGDMIAWWPLRGAGDAINVQEGVDAYMKKYPKDKIGEVVVLSTTVAPSVAKPVRKTRSAK